MSVLNSNNYKIAIVPEVTYGVQVKNLTTGGGVFFDSRLEWSRTPKTVDRSKKTNSLAAAPNETKVTGEMFTATMSGDLTDGHEILLQGYFDDASSPYMHPVHLGTTKSYNVYQLYLDATGACTHYDVLLGCAITQLTLTGEVNGIWQFSAKIEATSYRQYVANTSTDALTLASGLPVSGDPFLFGHTAIGAGMFQFTILSANIDLVKTMVDDKHRYQNSMAKINDAYIGAGGTVTWEEEWDGAANQTDQSYVQNETDNATSIVLANASKTWTFDLNGVITEATRPDADKGLYVGNYTMKLTASSLGDAPVNVTVASV